MTERTSIPGEPPEAGRVSQPSGEMDDWTHGERATMPPGFLGVTEPTPMGLPDPEPMVEMRETMDTEPASPLGSSVPPVGDGGIVPGDVLHDYLVRIAASLDGLSGLPAAVMRLEVGQLALGDRITHLRESEGHWTNEVMRLNEVVSRLHCVRNPEPSVPPCAPVPIRAIGTVGE